MNLHTDSEWIAQHVSRAKWEGFWLGFVSGGLVAVLGCLFGWR